MTRVKEYHHNKYPAKYRSPRINFLLKACWRLIIIAIIVSKVFQSTKRCWCGLEFNCFLTTRRYSDKEMYIFLKRFCIIHLLEPTLFQLTASVLLLACEDCDTKCNTVTAIYHARPTVKYSLFVGIQLALNFKTNFSHSYNIKRVQDSE